MQKEFDKFVDDLPGTETPFDINDELKDQPTAEPEIPVDDQTPPVEKEMPFAKNPKVQRFIEKKVNEMLSTHINNQAPREVPSKQPTTDLPPEWLAMYGDNEESRRAWTLQERLLDNYKNQAKQEAIAEIRSEQERADEAVREFEQVIETSLDELEETHGVDLTSNSPAAKKARNEYLDLVQRLSPKDRDGNVTSYADFHEVWDIYQSTKSGPDASRKQNLAARAAPRPTDTPTPKKGYEQGMGFDGIRNHLGLN